MVYYNPDKGYIEKNKFEIELQQQTLTMIIIRSKYFPDSDWLIG